MPRKSLIAGKREVLQLLTAVMRGEVTDWALKKTPEGEEAVPLKPKVGDRIKAAEMLSRYRALFENGAEGEACKSSLAREIEEAIERLGQE